MSYYTSIPICSNTNNSPSENGLPFNVRTKPAILTASEDGYFKCLLDLLENGNEEDFLLKYTSTDSLKNYNDIQVKLFNKALKKNSSRDVIEKIICNITNMDYINDRGYREYNTKIIEDICLVRNVEAFKILLSSKHLKLPTPMEILNTITTFLYEDLFDEWFDIILNVFDEFDVNEHNGKLTPMDFAYTFGKKNVIRKLLEAGTYIGTGSSFQVRSNRFHQALKPQIIRECFDSCIDEKLIHRKKCITFNYKNLVPPQSQPDLNEMMPIMQIINSKEHLDLLKHPLITSFMDLKWQRVSKYLYLNLFLYWFYLASIVSYIILTTGDKTESSFTNLTWWFTIFGTAYLIIREVIQLRYPKEYLQKISNYLELLLIIVSILIIAMQTVNKEIVVFGILLIALEFWILVRNLPISLFSTHILMLEEVLKTFITSFSLYSIFVFTFALCFFVLFGPEHQFENIFKSVVKTMAMVVGELNFADLNLEGFCSYILIFLFIICMAVVLMNLLNGLAVSDIQAIRQQAELNGIICRAKFLNNHDVKLFRKRHDQNKNIKECTCKYYVSGVRIFDEVLPIKIILPYECHHCYAKQMAIMPTYTEEWALFSFFLETFDLWIGNQSVVESAIAEAKTIIRNKKSETSKEQKQLEHLEQSVKNIGGKAENMDNNVLHIYKKSIINEQNVQNIEQKVENIENIVDSMENNVLDIYQKSLIIEQNLQNFEKQVTNNEKNIQNIETKVANIENEQQNIAKNIEELLKNMQWLREKTPQCNNPPNIK